LLGGSTAAVATSSGSFALPAPPGGTSGSFVVTQEEVTSEELAVDARVMRAIKVRAFFAGVVFVGWG